MTAPRTLARTVLATVAILLGVALGLSMTPSAQADQIPEDCFNDKGDAPVDVLLTFDLTGSMREEIDSAKADANELLASLEENLTDPRYGVASHMDYPGFYSYPGYSNYYGDADAGDYPWALNQTLTSDTTAVENAIDGLELGFGEDPPESYSRVFYEAATHDGWRTDAIKILVEWGDNAAHDDDFAGNNYGLDPGPDATEGGGDDIDFQEVVDRMDEAGVHAMMVDAGFGAAEPYYRYAANETGGAYAQLNDAEKLADEIDDLVDTIKANDTTPPSMAIDTPEPGHLYVEGDDQGPGTGTYVDRATLAGDAAANATASDNCDLEEAHFEVPGSGWSDSFTFPDVNSSPTTVTTSPIPASNLAAGNHTLNARALDWIDLNDSDEVGLHVPAPEYIEGPCASEGDVKGYVGHQLEFPVVASFIASGKDVVDVRLAQAPSGMTIASDAPANPVHANVTWPDPQLGSYTVLIEAEGPFGHVSLCRLTVTIETLDGEARSVGLWAGTSTPESAEYRSRGVHILDRGTERHRTVNLTQASGDLEADALDERGNVTVNGADVTASGRTEIAEVRLLGGLVRAQSLTHEAELAWNMDAQDGSVVNETRRIAHLEVAGEPIDVDETSDPVEVDLPGDGFLRLFERTVTQTSDGLAYRSNLIHVYTPDAYGGEEVIVGDLFLQAPNVDDRTRQSRAIEDQDDADSGRDAGPPGPPVEIDPGLYDGTFAAGDLVDRYVFQAHHGEKIKVNLEPAKGARAEGGHVGANGTQTSPRSPVVHPEATPHAIRLYDPGGDLRARAVVAEASGPQSVELNADVDGKWTVEIERAHTFGFGDHDRFDWDRYSFYSFDLTLTPVPLLPQNDALSGADAPPDCPPKGGLAPEIHDGYWPGVLRDDDRADLYRFQADIGDLVTATLKPGETADGVAMDLRLLGEDCQLLHAFNLGGRYTNKGLPGASLQLPASYTGTYYLLIERVNGVGNHHVTLSVRDPMPGLPTNDARTGQDADNDTSNATTAPSLAFQGSIRQGDAGDAYGLPMTAGPDSFVVLEMSALSKVNATLYDPAGTRVASQSIQNGTYAWTFQASHTGDYILLVEPIRGGGDYTVAWGQIPPALIPGPLAQSTGFPAASTSP